MAMRSSVVEPTAERLLREAGLKPGMRVQDIGCGGRVSLLLAQLVEPAGPVVGIDNSPEAVNAARQRAVGLSA
jgi:cyclopropane fatty-acyl-phospholipid synthase-like methyltransferase